MERYALTDLRDLTKPQRLVLEAVASDAALSRAFYLTGGTLLKARGIVPRESNDMDFFTFANIDSRLYTKQLVHWRKVLEGIFGPNQVQTTDSGFLHAASGMLIDAVADTVPNIDEFVAFGTLLTASLRDAAAHKASAICSRDELKDYVDIAFLTKRENWTLRDLEALADKKFALGTITEEKLLTELIAKREAFTVSPSMFLREPEKNAALVKQQIDFLINATRL